MSDKVEYLTLDDLIELTVLLMGAPPPIRDLGLPGSAAARSQASAFGQNAYGDLWSKAGALLQSIVKNHALVDGNKRLAWLATAVFLELNGVTVTDVSNDAVYELITDVAAGDRSPDEIAAKLRSTVLS